MRIVAHGPPVWPGLATRGVPGGAAPPYAKEFALKALGPGCHLYGDTLFNTILVYDVLYIFFEMNAFRGPNGYNQIPLEKLRRIHLTRAPEDMIQSISSRKIKIKN